jgi:hypothetical protein
MAYSTSSYRVTNHSPTAGMQQTGASRRLAAQTRVYRVGIGLQIRHRD